MSSLNFIGGEKGGVAKSAVARLLAQYFIDQDKAFVGFDTDRSHNSFTRFYADYAACWSTVLKDSTNWWACLRMRQRVSGPA